jgi:phosphoglycerate dehydrogenase-like enzyme
MKVYMDQVTKIAVCSRSFSKNVVLRSELLKRYAKVTFNDSGKTLSGNALKNFLYGQDKAITSLEIIDEDLLSCIPQLKVISKYGVGLDSIDLNAMCRYSKQLGWVGGINKRSVSELVISFAIGMLRRVRESNLDLVQGGWGTYVGGQLTGRTVGIIGCGHVGKDLVSLLSAFECKVLVYDVRDYSDFYKKNNITAVSLDELLKNADIISLHVPLNSKTEHMLNKNNMHLMKPTAVLINTARGGLVDEQCLQEMLKNGALHAAAFDVFEEEPFQNNELLKLDNFLATPHIGGSSNEAILAMGRAAIDGLENYYSPSLLLEEYS